MAINVLLVDDEAHEGSMGKWVELTLEPYVRSLGGNFKFVLSGAQARVVLKSRVEALKWDVVLIDQRMPGESGEELGTWLASSYEHLVLVLLTGEGTDRVNFGLSRRLMRIGFCEFLLKPDVKKRAELESAISNLLGLVSVKTKLKIGNNYRNPAIWIEALAEDHNNTLLNHYLANLTPKYLDVESKQTKELMELLHAQERVLILSELEGTALTGQAIAAGTILEMYGINVTVDYLRAFRVNKSHGVYEGLGLPKNRPDSSIQRFIQLYKPKAKLPIWVDGVEIEARTFSEQALIIMGLLFLFQGNFKTTIRRASSYKPPAKKKTLVDEHWYLISNRST